MKLINLINKPLLIAITGLFIFLLVVLFERETISINNENFALISLNEQLKNNYSNACFAIESLKIGETEEINKKNIFRFLGLYENNIKSLLELEERSVGIFNKTSNEEIIKLLNQLLLLSSNLKPLLQNIENYKASYTIANETINLKNSQLIKTENKVPEELVAEINLSLKNLNGTFEKFDVLTIKKWQSNKKLSKLFWIFFIAIFIILLCLAILINITIKSALIKSENEKKYLLKRHTAHLPGVLYQFKVLPDKTYSFPFVSESIENLYGITPEELMKDGTNIFNCVHPDDKKGLFNSFKELETSNKNWFYEYRIILPNQVTKWIRASSKPEKQEDGSVIWHGYLKDITDIKNKNEEIQLSKTKEDVLFMHGSTEAKMLLTRKKFFDCNFQTLEMFGMQDKSEFIDTHPADLSPLIQPDGKNSFEKANEMIEIAFEKGHHIFNWTHKRKNGDVFTAEVILFAFQYGEGVAIQATVHDLTEKLIALNKIKEDEMIFSSILDRLPVAVFGKDIKNNYQFSFWNKKAEEIFGITAEMCIGKTDYDFFSKEDADGFRKKDIQTSESIEVMDIPEESVESENKKGVYQTKKVVVKDLQGRPHYLLGVSEDITERKKTELKIIKSLLEKEILLKEVHHRVKNNLQIMLSILNLQYSGLKDAKTKEIIRDVISRIKAMSFIHEILYKTNDFSKINFSEYIQVITNNLIYSYSNNEKIKLKLKLGLVSMDLDSAIPCGLLINEIITNSLKYAFNYTAEDILKKKTLLISISLIESSEHIKLIIADNGIGFPSHIDYRNTASLGMQLVMDLTKQLGGTIVLDNSDGAKFTIIISKKKEINNRE